MSDKVDESMKRVAKKQALGQGQNTTAEKPGPGENESNDVETGSAALESQSPKGEKQIAVLAEESEESAAVSEMHPTKADYKPESPVFGGTLASGKERRLEKTDITEEESPHKLTTSEETIAKPVAKGEETVTLTSSAVESNDSSVNVEVEKDKEQDEALKQSHGEAVDHQARQPSDETEDDITDIMSDNGNKESQQVKDNKDVPECDSPALVVLVQSSETNKDSPSKIDSTQCSDPGESVYKQGDFFGDRKLQEANTYHETRQAAIMKEKGSRRTSEDGHHMDDDEERPSKQLRSDLYIELRMLLPSKVVEEVIGKEGENITRLRNQFKARISVPESRGPERVMSISANLDVVCDIIKDFIPTVSQLMNRGEDDHEIRLLIHRSHVTLVMGKGCMRIKKLREETGSQIKMYMDCAPFSLEQVVQITGSAEQIAMCVRAIYETIARVPPRGANVPYNPNNFDEVIVTSYGGFTDERGGQRSFSEMSKGKSEEVTTSEVYIPKEWAGVILGKDGEQSLQVEKESGTKIKVSDASDSIESIICTTGTHDQILYAEYLLHMIMHRHGWATA